MAYLRYNDLSMKFHTFAEYNKLYDSKVPQSKIEWVQQENQFRRKNQQIQPIVNVWQNTTLPGGMFFITIHRDNQHPENVTFFTMNNLKQIIPSIITGVAALCNQREFHVHAMIVTRTLMTTARVKTLLARAKDMHGNKLIRDPNNIEVELLYRCPYWAENYIIHDQGIGPKNTPTMFNMMRFPKRIPPWGNPYAQINLGGMFNDFKSSGVPYWMLYGCPRYMVEQLYTAPETVKLRAIKNNANAARAIWEKETKDADRKKYNNRVNPKLWINAYVGWHPFIQIEECNDFRDLTNNQNIAESKMAILTGVQYYTIFQCEVPQYMPISYDSVYRDYLDQPVAHFYMKEDSVATWECILRSVIPFYFRMEGFSNAEYIMISVMKSDDDGDNHSMIFNVLKTFFTEVTVDIYKEMTFANRMQINNDYISDKVIMPFIRSHPELVPEDFQREIINRAENEIFAIFDDPTITDDK